MTDERSESLAAQAAAWVPPWERAPREPDRAYQAAATPPDISDDTEEPAGADEDVASEPEEEGAGFVDDGAGAVDGGAGSVRDDARDDDADLTDDDAVLADDDAVLADDDAVLADDDAVLADDDAALPDANPAALPGEAIAPATVDEPAELPEGSGGPTDVGVGPELPVPASIEEATEAAEQDEAGAPVDAPVPADGDDAGDVFDQAADDDFGDDAEVDLPFAEEVPEAEPGAETAGAGVETDLDQPGAEWGAAGDEPGAGPESAAADDEPGAGPESAAADDEPGAGPESAAAGDGPGAAADVQAADESAGAAGAAGVAIPAQSVARRAPAAAVGAPETRTTDDPDPAKPPLDDAELRAALEAILLVVDEPVAEMQLAQIMAEPAERVAAMLEDISARYTAAGHGFDLRRAAGGWRLYTRPEYAAYVERFVLDGQSVRLTQAALETLAVVAYKQPVTRSRISAIRGVNCDGVMRTLTTRGLIEECGTEPETGAHLYRTTALFLEKLGLNSVDQLPPLAPFLPDDVEEVLDASG